MYGDFSKMSYSSLTNIFSSNYEWLKGRDAWNENLRLAAFASQRVYSSLGPNGAYKMVTYNRGPEKIVKISRDTVAVLEELAIKYPTVAILAEAAKMQRQEIGDGVTSFIILTSALLKNADKIIKKGIHPVKILEGYLEAGKKSLKVINLLSQDSSKNSLDEFLRLLDCGRDCLTKEIREILVEATHLLTLDSVLDKDKFRIIRKPGGNIWETKLMNGLVLKNGKYQPNMPNIISKPRIAITSERVGVNMLEVKMPREGPFPIKFNIETPEQRIACKEAEQQQKYEALKKLEILGVTALFSQQPIDSYSKNKLLKMGIAAFESVNRQDLELICKATGTRMVGNLADLTALDLGKADCLETDKIELENIVTLAGCDFVTFIIRGSTVQALDEIELLINNALSLLKIVTGSGLSVAGGGAIEMQMAKQLKSYALQFAGREQLAIDAFAEAVLDIPRCLATNSGLCPDEAVGQLSKLHSEGLEDYGITADGTFGKVGSEPAEVKISVIKRALEVVSLMLRIDQQIKSKEITKFHKKG